MSHQRQGALCVPSIFITGTDTGVGKTIVTAGLARLLAERGESVGVMKQAETGWDGPSDALPADAAFLAAAAQVNDAPEDIVPYVYREPLSPLVAARREERSIEIEVIEAAYDRLRTRYDHVLVEGAGGLSVSLTEDVDMAGLAVRLRLPVLIVARPSLGTLNHTYLTVRYARERELRVAGIVLCAAQPLTGSIAEATNPARLEEKCGVPVLGTVPFRENIKTPEDAAEVVREALDLDLLFSPEYLNT